MNVQCEATSSSGSNRMLRMLSGQNCKEIVVMPKAYLVPSSITWLIELQEQERPLCGHS